MIALVPFAFKKIFCLPTLMSVHAHRLVHIWAYQLVWIDHTNHSDLEYGVVSSIHAQLMFVV